MCDESSHENDDDPLPSCSKKVTTSLWYWPAAVMRGVQPLPSVWLTTAFFTSSTNWACSEVNIVVAVAASVADSTTFVLSVSFVVLVGQSVNCARQARSTSSSSNSLSVVKCPARAARDSALHFLLLRLLISAVDCMVLAQHQRPYPITRQENVREYMRYNG